MTVIANDLVADKTKELAEAIIAQPGFQDKISAIETFIASDSAKAGYQAFMEKRQELHYKEQQGQPLTTEDRENIEKMQSDLLADSTTKAFLDAQESLNTMHQAVVGYIGKAMELGRVPTEEELSGCCGGGGGGGEASGGG